MANNSLTHATLRYILSLSLSLAMDVACLRPSDQARGGQLTAPSARFSHQQSNKLWSLLTKLYAKGGYSHTFGALDPVQVTQMAPHLSSIYVSGWQCSSTASTTNEPGPDVADYPVCNKNKDMYQCLFLFRRFQKSTRSHCVLTLLFFFFLYSVQHGPQQGRSFGSCSIAS